MGNCEVDAVSLPRIAPATASRLSQFNQHLRRDTHVMEATLFYRSEGFS